MSFVDHKTKLLQALERSDWPISQRDVVLLENEMKQGEVYIQQAQELEDAALGKGLPPAESEKDSEDSDKEEVSQPKVGGSDTDSQHSNL